MVAEIYRQVARLRSCQIGLALEASAVVVPLTWWCYEEIVSAMTPTTRHQQALYLDHDKARLLDELSADAHSEGGAAA